MGKVVSKAAMIVGGIALIATGAGAIFGAAAVTAALGGISAAALTAAAGVLSIGSSLLNRPKSPPVSEANRDRLVASIDPRAPRVFAFGHTALATDIRDQEFVGDKQEFLHRFIVVAAHRVNSVLQIWFDDKLAWTSTGGVQGEYAGYLDVAIITEGSAANAINISARMGNSRRFTGCAYVHLRYKLAGNSKKTESPFSSSVPSRMTIVGEGAACYDPRQDSTVPGGSGSHRADDQATWTWGPHCRNPAIQLGTYFLGWRINGKLSVGKGIPPDRIDWPSFITAANLCDEPVILAAGGTEPRYRTDGLFTENDDATRVVDIFKASMNAELDDIDGEIRLTVLHNDLAAPVGELTTEDVLGSYKWLQTPSLSESFNVVRGGFVDTSPNSLYQMNDYPEVRLPSPDGIDRVHPADFGLVQSPGQAQRLASQRLQREQYQGTFTAEFQYTAWRFQKGDVIRFTFDPEGFTSKLFRIIETHVRVDGVVPMVLKEEHPAIYQWDGDERPAVQPAAPTVYDPRNLPALAYLETIEEGATVGAPPGTPVGDVPAEEVIETINEHSDAIGSNTGAIASQGLTIDQILLDIEDLELGADIHAQAAAASAAAAAASAAAAAVAQTAAEQAETDAVAAALASADSATLAAGHATTASAHKDAAAGSATAASGSATAAQTAAGNASTSEANAATSATNASGSASAAATSATVAANARDATALASALLLPDRPIGATQYQSDATGEPVAGTSTGAIVTDPTYGVVLDPDATNTYLKGLIPVTPGVIYEFEYLIKASSPSWRALVARLTGSYALAGSDVLYSATLTGSSYKWLLKCDDVLSATPNAAWLRIGFQNTSGNASLRIVRHSVRDVTAREAASQFASAAATSASSAAGSVTAAGEHAQAAQTAATNASTSAGSASTHASNASSSATSAQNSANAASQSAGTAATARDQASGHASAASTSASNSAASATAAGTAATSASNHANTASNAASTAGTHASNAASSAASASDSASAAQSSAVLSASVAVGGLNKNGVFANWPGPSGTLPANWDNWIAGDQNTKVAGTLSPWAVRHVVTSSTHYMGFAQLVTGVSPGWYVIEADVDLVSGSFGASGINVVTMSDSATLGSVNLRFDIDPDIDGVVGSGSNPTKRRWIFRKLVRLDNPATRRIDMYVMSNWGGGNWGGAVPKTIVWHKASIRPASQAEVEARQAAATLSSLSATVSTLSGSIVTLQGRALAYWQQTTNAGASGTFIEARAEATWGGGSTSQVSIGAREVHLYNQIGSVWKKAMSVIAGGVIVHGDLDVGGAIRIGSRRIPIALQSFSVAASDGQVVDFGTDLVNIPKVEFDVSALPALPSGQSYDVKALNLSPTGFTMRAKTVTQGAPTSQSTGAGTYVGGDPAYRAHKPSAGNSASGNYTFKASGNITIFAIPNEPTEGTVLMDCYVRRNGAWQMIGTIQRSVTAFNGSMGGPTSVPFVISGQAYFADDIPVTGDYEFGISVYSFDGSITTTSFLGVDYETPGSQGGEAAIGQSIPTRIIPQNV